MKFKPFLLVSLVVVLLLAACAPAAVEVVATEEPKPTATPIPEPTEEPMAEMDIVDTAVADGRFTTLVAAVQAAGLVDALKAEGPLTVFAPTDDAFAALPEGTVEALLADIPALTNILLYHVVEGKVMAADVVELSSVSTLLGQDLNVSLMDGKVMLNGSQVIIADLETSNGVIHVIDTVLLPQ
jgi:transforming growth factor-beta-induced protein